MYYDIPYIQNLKKKQTNGGMALGSGKLNSHMQKNEIGPFPYTTHENRLKMDEGPQCEKEIH